MISTDDASDSSEDLNVNHNENEESSDEDIIEGSNTHANVQEEANSDMHTDSDELSPR
ncbi:hypothetical protein A2U01_0077332, partial [Trifolium medium]|nr:hypothetical protein [Trifolium medium]